jgi:hypothetical protein
MITMKESKHSKKEGTKTVWILESEESRVICFDFHRDMTSPDTLKFFRRCGGTETTQESYTSKGYLVTKLTSIKPAKEFKIVRTFDFDSKGVQ